MHGLCSFVLLTLCVVQGLKKARENEDVQIPLPPAKPTACLNALYYKAHGSRVT